MYAAASEHSITVVSFTDSLSDDSRSLSMEYNWSFESFHLRTHRARCVVRGAAARAILLIPCRGHMAPGDITGGG